MSDVVRAPELSTDDNDITAYVGTDQFTMAIFNKTISEMNTALSQRAKLSGGKIPESYLPYKIILHGNTSSLPGVANGAILIAYDA